MAKLTVVFGLLLAVIGFGGHVMYGSGLHPLYFGLVLVVCGVLSMTENAKQRMIFMHIAVLVGLLGCVIPGSMSAVALVKAHNGQALERGSAVHEQVLVAVVCLVYVVLCVRSFITARRGNPA